MDEQTGAAALTRKDFLKTSAVTAAALLTSGNYAFAAQGTDRIGVGVIGCGGRGTGAAGDCANAAPGVEIVALGDLFEDRVKSSRENLKGLGDKLKVTDARCFSGFDAYRKVIATPGVDLVILATPPGFRPAHLKAAVEAASTSSWKSRSPSTRPASAP
jgi:hypothetical protein